MNPVENKYFTDLADLTAFVAKKKHDGIVVTHQHVPGYAGMVLYIGIYFHTARSLYTLNHEWMCLGLDLYGDTLQESYSYQFGTLEDLTQYLQSRYNIAVMEIQREYTGDFVLFPNPITHPHRKSEFEEAWKRFQEDFATGIFRDHSQRLYTR